MTLTAAQQARARRLLARAEAEDARRAAERDRLAERDRVAAERLAAKEAQAEDWTRRFHAAGWTDATALVQTNVWDETGPRPSLWVRVGNGLSSEEPWERLLAILEA